MITVIISWILLPSSIAWLCKHMNSTSDDSCHVHLIETVETLPIKSFVERVVCKVLGNCMKASGAAQNPDINRTGSSQLCQFCCAIHWCPTYICVFNPCSSSLRKIIFHLPMLQNLQALGQRRSWLQLKKSIQLSYVMLSVNFLRYKATNLSLM